MTPEQERVVRKLLDEFRKSRARGMSWRRGKVAAALHELDRVSPGTKK